MKDQDFLIWLHKRLTDHYGEDPLVDYLHKLRAVISCIDADKATLNVTEFNSVEEVEEFLKRREEAKWTGTMYSEVKLEQLQCGSCGEYTETLSGESEKEHKCPFCKDGVMGVVE